MWLCSIKNLYMEKFIYGKNRLHLCCREYNEELEKSQKEYRRANFQLKRAIRKRRLQVSELKTENENLAKENRRLKLTLDKILGIKS